MKVLNAVAAMGDFGLSGHYGIYIRIFAISIFCTRGSCGSGVPTTNRPLIRNSTRFVENGSMTSSSTMHHNQGALNANVMRIAVNKSRSSMSEVLCPEFCICPFMTDETENVLSCDGQHLFEWTSALLSFKGINVTSILLQNFRRSDWKQSGSMELMDAPLGGSSLRELKLPRNGINAIKNPVFASLSGLIRLSLDHNKLSALTNWTFIGLRSLSRLDLSYNVIAALDLAAFSPLSSLIELDLSNNAISQIPNELFKGLQSLQHLSLDQNQIHDIQPDAFVGSNQLVHVNLAMNPLTDSILSDLKLTELHGLQYLDLSHCKLSTIPQNLPGTIRDVRLSGNNFTSLTRKCFERYHKLAVLTLDDCNISCMEDGALGVLGSLQHLWMQNNFIRSFPRGLPFKLKGLYLDQNLIRSLQRSDVGPLFDLEEVRLERNQISVIESCVFCDMPHLNLLDLRANRLDMLNTSLFPADNALSKLDLSLNPLRIIDSTVFAALSMLKQLEMSRVDTLSVNSQEILRFLPHLTALDISGSPALAKQILHDITASSSNSTVLLPHLHSLNIRNCGLSFADYQLQVVFSRLSRIKMTQNNIECSSENQWLIEMIQKQPSRFQRAQELKCSGPRTLKDYKIISVDAKALRPSHRPGSTTAKHFHATEEGRTRKSTMRFSSHHSGHSMASAFDQSHDAQVVHSVDMKEGFSRSWIITAIACALTATIVSLTFILLICCCSFKKFHGKRMSLFNKISSFLGWSSAHTLADRAASDRTLYRSQDDSIFMIGTTSPFPPLSPYEELEQRQSVAARELRTTNTEYHNDAMSLVSSVRSCPFEILV